MSKIRVAAVEAMSCTKEEERRHADFLKNKI
jgi:hypothetical protein